MTRTFVAALALACAFSSHAFAFAPDYAAEPNRVPLGLLMLGAAVALMFVAKWSRIRIVMTVCLMSVLGAGFAFSAEAAPVTTVAIPWGDYIVSAGQMLTAILLPVLVGFIMRAVYQVAPWARLVLTQARIEQMTKAVTDYALNAVEGAAKGQTLTIPVGSAVIAKGVQRAVDVVPAKVLAAAGGEKGVAELIFRTLKLEDGANAANTLAPAQAALGGK